MSKKAKTPAKLKYKAAQKLPKLNNIKEEWDLKNLYYKSERDPKLERDIKTTERLYENFSKKWRSRNFTSSSKILLEALKDKEKLATHRATSAPARYLSFRTVINAKDTVAQKELDKLSLRLTKSVNKTIFFTLKLAAIPKQKQKKFLADPALERYHYYLERVFLSAKHHLTESEEKIINLKYGPAHEKWFDATEKIVSNRTITWKGKVLPIPEAIETIDVLSTKEKVRLWELLTTELSKIGEFAEHEINAIFTDMKIEDELRGYEKPYSATLLSYEDDEQSVENLLKAVSTKGFSLSKRFYKAKAKVHGVSELHYTQKYDSIGEAPRIPFKQAVDICRDVFYTVKPVYGEIFDDMLEGGQIDVYPKPGKRGGAFMSSDISQPTHVFLNHLSNFKSLETLAHEMGHAIHSERSKKQPPFYQGHSITTAETASTLFENLLFDAVYDQTAPELQPILLHDRITRDTATIQRQIAFFNCELEMHQTIREKGNMTNEELAACMSKHLRSYLGSAVSVEDRDGYSYVYIPHLRYGFYVYTYTFGILMSTIMANQYKEDPSFLKQIDKFLTLGQSATVADIFKEIGIDTKKPDTFVNALKNYETDVRSFETYVKKQTK